ncbi:hypothetical protein ISN45_Aa01g035000 [Arabidopsis thaliana x Arabidopsis arenosa]|uniref:Uncharacterized protein n=1 Tax=Arabidopsis thaliana x Arabidopsis arenosa TaxID=1240361 RepID=A0A8T2C620_9BRAS|nr:hypothetical protein ISN45_Aa01g035000 [Arabidopsis thaliana x Arabidopsis arenosa]
MANVGNTSGSTRFEELCREITQLNDEIQNLVREDVLLNHPIGGRPDFGAIEKSKKKLTDKRMKLEELEKRKEVMKETPQ